MLGADGSLECNIGYKTIKLSIGVAASICTNSFLFFSVVSHPQVVVRVCRTVLCTE